tara:strand:- start:59 stop:805 length:747 start_codon:yes stop_codon:yes gene_type:complete
MNKVEMKLVEHDVKIGNECGNKTANITEDSLFILDGEPIGFYIKNVQGKMRQLLNIANNEFRGDNVPKSEMRRSNDVRQYSTILGSVPSKPNMRRPYPSISSVHQKPKAKNFIKSMKLLVRESEALIKEHLPKIYKKQKEIIQENVAKKWQLSIMFTSSISNYNISAAYHRDTGNLKDTVNVIFSKRFDSVGGYLNVPDYDVTIECADNSMICYPAWKNVHGVTPIIPLSEGGYRNSLIFYPLKGFAN